MRLSLLAIRSSGWSQRPLARLQQSRFMSAGSGETGGGGGGGKSDDLLDSLFASQEVEPVRRRVRAAYPRRGHSRLCRKRIRTRLSA